MGSLKTSSGVWSSLPGQNGQDASQLGNSLACFVFGRCWGRLALSGAVITHALVVGSCLSSDNLSSTFHFELTSRLNIHYFRLERRRLVVIVSPL